MVANSETSTVDFERGCRWGAGEFSEPEVLALRNNLGRANGSSLVAALGVLGQRGNDATAAAAQAALVSARALGTSARSALFLHPATAYEVSRLVGAIAQAGPGGIDAASIIDSGIMRVVRGAALAGGEECAWRELGGTVLPGIGIIMLADGWADAVVHGSEVIVRIDGSERLRAPLAECLPGVRMATGESPWILPSFRIGDARIHVDMQDPAFVEWIARSEFSGTGISAARLQDLPGWVGHLEAAARVVEETLPVTANVVGHCVRSFVPIVSRFETVACSMSDSGLPGAIMSTVDGPPVLAESIVHEFRHNLLHQLERCYPLYADDSPRGADYYSPWRDDLRPLHGILHALFVFLDVCAIHAGVRARGLGTEHDMHDSAVRLCANVRRIRMALDEFRGNARLTAFGSGFVRGIEIACDGFEPILRQLPCEAVHDAEVSVARHAALQGRSA